MNSPNDNPPFISAPTWSANFDVPMETTHGAPLDSVGSDVWSTEEPMPAKETGWASFSEFTSSLRWASVFCLEPFPEWSRCYAFNVSIYSTPCFTSELNVVPQTGLRVSKWLGHTVIAVHHSKTERFFIRYPVKLSSRVFSRTAWKMALPEL